MSPNDRRGIPRLTIAMLPQPAQLKPIARSPAAADGGLLAYPWPWCRLRRSVALLLHNAPARSGRKQPLSPAGNQSCGRGSEKGIILLAGHNGVATGNRRIKSSPDNSMIVRIFRVEIDPATRSAFEVGFQSLSVDAVTQSPGNLSCEIGMPTRWSPNTYAMISR